MCHPYRVTRRSRALNVTYLLSPEPPDVCVCGVLFLSLALTHSFSHSLTHSSLHPFVCLGAQCCSTVLILCCYCHFIIMSPLFFFSLFYPLSLSLSFSSYFVNSPWSIFYLPLPNTCNHSFFFFLSLYFISSLISLYIFAPIFASFLSVYPFLTSALF